MYRHPEAPYTELGLGGRFGLLMVWLFGREWTTRPLVLDASRWYMVCVTWTHRREKPVLYIDGHPEDITEGGSSAPPHPYSDHLHDNSPSAPPTPARSLHTTPSPPSSSSSKLAPNGTLTLGAKHRLVDGNVQADPVSGMLGRLSLFRLWGRERSREEVTSLRCTEGDLLTWWTGPWDAGACPAPSAPTLRCGEPRRNRPRFQSKC